MHASLYYWSTYLQLKVGGETSWSSIPNQVHFRRHGWPGNRDVVWGTRCCHGENISLNMAFFRERYPQTSQELREVQVTLWLSWTAKNFSFFLRSFTSSRWGTMFEQGSLWWGLLLFVKMRNSESWNWCWLFSHWRALNAFEVCSFFSMTNTLFLGWTSSTVSYFPPWNTSDDSAPILAIKSNNFSSQLYFTSRLHRSQFLLPSNFMYLTFSLIFMVWPALYQFFIWCLTGD